MIAITIPISVTTMIATCIQIQWRGTVPTVAPGNSAGPRVGLPRGPTALAGAERYAVTTAGKLTVTPRGTASTGEVAFSIAFHAAEEIIT